MKLSRRHFTAAATVSLAMPSIARAATTELIVAEPLHGTGYLPLYVAMRQGFFEAEKVSVKLLTMESGSGHINAVLSGQAFAFIGGPEHNAYAKIKGAEIRAVANVVDRGNVYLVARPGVAVDPKDMAATLKGRTIAGGYLGGTPNSITRYIVGKAGLKPIEDVKILEINGAAQLAALKAGQADFATVSEPTITQGIRAGIWGEPFYNVPKELGPYAYSTLNVRKESIDTNKDAVAGFVRGVMRGLEFTYANPDEAAKIAKADFPTMNPDDLKATLTRTFADELWSKKGLISEQSWTTAKSVVMAAGLLKQDVPYDAIIDMSFVANA